jgi:hypothetical protein
MPGPKPKPIRQFPPAIKGKWKDPIKFSSAFGLQMRRHGDTPWSLWKAIVRPGDGLTPSLIRCWRRGTRKPSHASSLEILERIEARYRLPDNYFAEKLLIDVARWASRKHHERFSGAQTRVLRWHLPDDFVEQSFKKQQEILQWVRENVLTEGSRYSRYMSEIYGSTFALRFSLSENLKSATPTDRRARRISAPLRLDRELKQLVKFKTEPFSNFRKLRGARWNEGTVELKLRQYGLMFGAIHAPSDSKSGGLGMPLSGLTFGLLVFPGMWDWFLKWREQRRGFFINGEADMLFGLAMLTSRHTGWLRQNPQVLEGIRPYGSQIARRDITRAKNDWDSFCDETYRFAKNRALDIKRVARVHRDTFHPIMSILEAPSPLGEYRKIILEIQERIPPRATQPLEAAEAVRANLILQLGIHLGVRQRNLREMLFCRKKEQHRSELSLQSLRRGELRWNSKRRGWEVIIPYQAFKNAQSTFFGRQPFRLLLPNVANLYALIEEYLQFHRSELLGKLSDPGTFFVRTSKRLKTRNVAEYTVVSMADAWKVAIQRYGIYNPYTKRGAIKGLLPHGPHCVRDVLATHMLKMTGSYDLAGYAIQATPQTVSRHYGRFLPVDKSAQAAQVLNRAWHDA